LIVEALDTISEYDSFTESPEQSWAGRAGWAEFTEKENHPLNKVEAFFEKFGHDVKVGVEDIEGLVKKLFGAQALANLETTAESLLQSDLGQAVLGDAESLLAQVETGQVSQASAIESLASSAVAAAKKTGIALEQSIATTFASMAIAKLSGAIQAPAVATPPPPAAA
jgi:hypothetical protein